MLYALCADSFCVFCLTLTDHNPFDLHPVSIGCSAVLIMRVPCFWTVTPWVQGWNIVVYPSFAILLMLSSGRLSPGSMSALCAVCVRLSKGSIVFCDACRVVSSRRYIVFCDGPRLGRRSVSSVTKCDIVPKLMIIFCSFHLVTRLVNLFPFNFVDVFWIMLIVSFFDCSSSSSSSCCSGVQ